MANKAPSKCGGILLAVVLLALTGCHKIVKTRAICLRSDIATTANQNQPVAVDILLVRDKDLLKKLMTLTAADWFVRRTQIMRDFPDAKDLVVSHHEWVPGQLIPCYTLTLDPMPRATILFAGYSTPGDHRARLVNGKSATIRLLEDDVEILPLAQCTPLGCPTDSSVRPILK